MKRKLLTNITLGLWMAMCLYSLIRCTQTRQESNPSIIEIVAAGRIPAKELEQFCLSKNIQASVYQWKNHLVLYGIFSDLQEILKQLATAYPGAVIKGYDKPFYVFDRRSCDNPTTVPYWTHTIMTTNLVADEQLQQEYMHYHAAQSEQFPEVAQGFCNAYFQQLLVFRNGRQLMLVISIPEGENLDELNLKTTENNPRVDEWNRIMTKYQEGIEGTAPGETWVTFR